MQDIIENAPKLMEYLDEESSVHFEQLKLMLDKAGIGYSVNTRLVRGLDYYCKTVFEWVTDQLGAQGTVCAGGRYDGLVAQLGGRETPAAGFAMGIERLLALMEDQGFQHQDAVDVFMALQGEKAQVAGLLLSERIRDQWPELKMTVNCGGGSFKAQMKKADKSGATLALILGEDEILNNVISVKHLRQQIDQETVSQDTVVETIRDWLAK